MPKISPLIWEILRKSVHLSGLLIVVGYTLILNYFSESVAILSMTGLLLLLLEAEHIRVEHKPRIIKMFSGLFRKHEQNNLSGAAFLMISCIICFSAFNYWIAILALFMTVFGDIFAAIFGRAFGKTVIYKNKTLVGTLAGLTANTAVGFLILPEFLLLFLPMAFTATLVEFLTNKLDDNLTVPLFAGFVGQMIAYFAGLNIL